MKKTIYITIFIIHIISSVIIAQNIEIKRPGGSAILNGGYVYVEGSANDAVLNQYLWIYNNSTTDDITVSVRRIELDVVAGTKNSTCWFFCPPSFNTGDSVDWISPYNNDIAPGAFDGSFASNLEPQGVSGCSRFRYYFYDRNGPANQDSVDVYFSHGAPCEVTSNNLKVNTKNDFNIYPNPSKDVVNIHLNSSNISAGKIVITNVLGQEIYKEEVKGNISNSIKFNVSNLDAGLYFVSLYENNKIQNTKKLQIVK
jgi:hypothetical protein